MKLPHPLFEGRLLRRYKRFLADVAFAGGETVTAHCANPGSMMGLAAPGMRVWLSRSDDPKRRLCWSWELAEADGALIGINTARANAIAEEAIRGGVIPELAGYRTLRREVRYGQASRVDFLLEEAGRPPCYVEVKNVHLRRGDRAEFPDAVTARGARHLAELAAQARAGARAVLLYVVQRPDCAGFRVAADIDPTYARAMDEALLAGVERLCYACTITPDAIALGKSLPWDDR